MRIAMLAPPWIRVPPPAYGGIEEVEPHLSDDIEYVGEAGADEIDPHECRRSCEQRFSVPAVVDGYEEVYRLAVGRAPAAPALHR